LFLPIISLQLLLKEIDDISRTHAISFTPPPAVNAMSPSGYNRALPAKKHSSSRGGEDAAQAKRQRQKKGAMAAPSAGDELSESSRWWCGL